jgi:hypothetical protein
MHVARVRRVAVHKVVQVPAGGLRSLGTGTYQHALRRVLSLDRQVREANRQTPGPTGVALGASLRTGAAAAGGWPQPGRPTRKVTALVVQP